MMPIDAMYTRAKEPRVLSLESLNVWPPAPGIPELGPVKCGQLDDEYRRIDTIIVKDRKDEELRRKLTEYAQVHGRVRVAFTYDGYRQSEVAVWV